MSSGNGVDKVAEFHARWEELAYATAEQHPDADVETWLLYEARGVIVYPDRDPDDPHSGRIEWVA